MPDETILRVGIEFDISALKSGMAEASALSKSELGKLKSDYASAAVSVKSSMSGLAESVRESSENASAAVAELRAQIDGLSRSELTGAAVAAQSAVPATQPPLTLSATPPASVVPPVSNVPLPVRASSPEDAAANDEVAEALSALPPKGYRRSFAVPIRDDRPEGAEVLEQQVERAGTSPYTVLSSAAPVQAVQPIAPAEVTPQIAPTPAQQVVQAIPAAEVKTEVTPTPAVPPEAAVAATKPQGLPFFAQNAVTGLRSISDDAEKLRADQVKRNRPIYTDPDTAERIGQHAYDIRLEAAQERIDEHVAKVEKFREVARSKGLDPEEYLREAGLPERWLQSTQAAVPTTSAVEAPAAIPSPSSIPAVAPITEPAVAAKASARSADNALGPVAQGRADFEESGGKILSFAPHTGADIEGDFLNVAAHPKGPGTDEGIRQLHEFNPQGSTRWPPDLQSRLAEHGFTPENIVGYSRVHPDVDNPAEMSAVATHVAEDYRRQGVATGLYDAAESAQSERLGRPAQMQPSVNLTEDAQAFWRSRNPEATAGPAITPVSEPATAAKASVAAAEVALQEPRTRSILGSETRIPVPGESTVYQGRYALREAEEVEPSHNPQTFEANPLYEHRNDRDYTKAEAKARVIQQAQNFDPAYHLSDNPDAVNGPSIVDPRGNVLGGNSRAMALQRAYASENPEAAAAYREMLTAKAPGFGIDPAQVAEMQQPMLVRQLGEVANPQSAITDFNKTGTAALSAAERAVADSHRVSPKTLDYLASKISDEGEEGTLAKVLGGSKGPEVIKRLVDDQVITPQERPQYLDERGLVSPEGKQRVSRLMTGRLFDTSEDYENAAPEVRSKLEKVVGPVARTEGIEGFNITPQVKEGVAIQTEARQRGVRNLDDLRSQQGMFVDRGYSDEGYAIARQLNEPQPKIAGAFRQYASDAEVAERGPGFGFHEPPTRQRAFADAFNQGNVIEPVPGAGVARSEEPVPVQKAAITDVETEFRNAEAERRTEIEQTSVVQKQRDREALDDVRERKELAAESAAPPAAPPPAPPSAPPAGALPPDDEEEKRRKEAAAREEQLKQEKASIESVASTSKEVSTKEVTDVQESLDKQTASVEQKSSTEKSSIEEIGTTQKESAQNATVDLHEQLTKQKAEFDQSVSNVKSLQQEMAAVPSTNVLGKPNTALLGAYQEEIDKEITKQGQLREQERATTQAIQEQQQATKATEQSQVGSSTVDSSASKIQEAEAQKTAAVVDGEAAQDAAVEAGEVRKTASYQKAGADQTAEINRTTSRSKAAVEEATAGAKQASSAQAEEAKKGAAASAQSAQDRIRAVRAGAAAEVEASGSVASVLRLHLALQGEEQKRLASQKSQILKAMTSEELAASRAGVEASGQASTAMALLRKQLQETVDAQAALAAETRITALALEQEAGAASLSGSKMAMATVEAGALSGSTGRIEYGMMKVAATSKVLGPIMERVFPAFLALGFLEILSQMPEKIREMADEIAGFGKEEQKQLQQFVDDNQRMTVENLKFREAMRDSSTIGLVGLAKTNVELRNLKANLKDVSETNRPKIDELNDLGKKVDELKNKYDNVAANPFGIPGWSLLIQKITGTKAALDDARASLESVKKTSDQLTHEQKFEIPEKTNAATRTASTEAMANARELAKAEAEATLRRNTTVLEGDAQYVREERSLFRMSADEETRQLQADLLRRLQLQQENIEARRAQAITAEKQTGKPAAPELQSLGTEEIEKINAYRRESAQLEISLISEQERVVAEATRTAIDLNKRKGEAEVRLEEQTAREVYAATREGAEAHAALLLGAAQKETAALVDAENKRGSVEKQALEDQLKQAEALSKREPYNETALREIIVLNSDIEIAEKDHQSRLADIRRQGDRESLADHKRYVSEMLRLSAELAKRQEEQEIGGLEIQKVDVQRKYIVSPPTSLNPFAPSPQDQERQEIGQIELQELDVKRQGLQKQLNDALAENRAEGDGYRKLVNEKEKLDQEYEIKKKALENQALAAELAAYRHLAQQITSNFFNGLNQWIQGQKKFSEAMRETWNSIVMDVIKDIEKMGAKWIEEHILMAAVKKLLGIDDTSAQPQQIAKNNTANVAMATSDANMAAAAAFVSAMESLPFPANVAVAPAAAASALATGMTFAAGAAFEKGGIVPEDMIAKVHAKEMVLPERISEHVMATAGSQRVEAPLGASGWSNVYSDIRTLHDQTRTDLQSSIERLSLRTENYKETIAHLASVDREVRTHEEKHVSAAGPYAVGGPHYSFVLGPDGKNYAVTGYVTLNASPVQGDPQATAAKMHVIEASARAPSEMSDADRGVAHTAYTMRHEALRELSASHYKESQQVEPAMPVAYPAMHSVAPSVILPSASLDLFGPQSLGHAVLSSNVAQNFANTRGDTHIHVQSHPTFNGTPNMSKDDFGRMLHAHTEDIGRMVRRESSKFNRY